MFHLDTFIADCRSALTDADPRGAVREVVERAVSDPASLIADIGEPTRAGVRKLHHTADLTILDLSWGPGMTLYPHNHQMWANIGIYTGREDNTFWRRSEAGLDRHGVKVLEVGEVGSLGENAIHSVHNPLGQITSALHVYGGDFFNEPRSEWDPETLEEMPYSVERAMEMFERSNAALDAAKSG